jgi:hypothetical protein
MVLGADQDKARTDPQGGLVEREVQVGDRQGNRMSKIGISR